MKAKFGSYMTTKRGLSSCRRIVGLEVFRHQTAFRKPSDHAGVEIFLFYHAGTSKQSCRGIRTG